MKRVTITQVIKGYCSTIFQSVMTDDDLYKLLSKLPVVDDEETLVFDGQTVTAVTRLSHGPITIYHTDLVDGN